MHESWRESDSRRISSPGNDSIQKDFRSLLLRLRDGESTESDWKVLQSRLTNNIPDQEKFHKSAVKLSFSNEQVSADNFQRLQNLGNPIACISAKHSNKKATSLPVNDMGGLSPKLFFCKGARVMLTKNLWTELGLCNGAMGHVWDIIYLKGVNPPDLPLIILVQLDQYYNGPSAVPGIPRCVPISAVISTSDSLGSFCERQQFPLKLSWAITIHKS